MHARPTRFNLDQDGACALQERIGDIVAGQCARLQIDHVYRISLRMIRPPSHPHPRRRRMNERPTVLLRKLQGLRVRDLSLALHVQLVPHEDQYDMGRGQ